MSIDPVTSPATPPGRLRLIGLPLAALLVMLCLFWLPIWGGRFNALASVELRPRLSVTALALQAWAPAVAIVQIILLVLPARWTKDASRGAIGWPLARHVRKALYDQHRCAASTLLQ